MVRELDEKVIAGFIEEAKSYLPKILQGIEAYRVDSDLTAEIEEAYRYVHTIKGASSMVGLANLSHIANFNELILEDIKDGKIKLDDENTELLCKSVSIIGEYIDGMLSDTLHEDQLLLDVIRIHHRIMGLPGADDDVAMESILTELLTSSSPKDKNKTEEREIGESLFSYPEGVPSDVIDSFTIEVEDHLHDINTLLAALEKEPEDKASLQDIRRSLHTLKGTASAVGFQALSSLAHRTEDLLDLLYDGHLEVSPDIMDLLYVGTEIMDSLIASTDRYETFDDTLTEFYSALSAAVQSVPQAEKYLLSETMFEDSAFSTEQISGDSQPPVIRKPSEVVRITLDRLDEMVRLVSELVINRSAFEQRLIDFTQEVEELGLTSERLRRISTDIETEYEASALGGRSEYKDVPSDDDAKIPVTPSTHGFDDLEFDRYTEFHLLSRDLVETTSDIRTLSTTLNTLLDDFEGILTSQGRISSEIQDRLMKARMVPISTLSSRFNRVVRALSRDQDKLIDFNIEGENIGLDKAVLEEISDPLLHLLRNAVDHGIEPPSTRKQLGKSERGEIHFSAYQESNQVVLQVRDDGAGLEPEAIRAAAIKDGFLSKKEAQNLSERELTNLILLPGFSTVGEISEVSGRGVGLDIVRSKVQKLKGSLTIESAPGHGMSVTIILPISMAAMQALLVRTHDELFALPLYAVKQILRLDEGLIEQVNGEQIIQVGEEIYPVLRLGDVLNLPNPADDNVQRPPVLLIRAGDNQAALIVDYLLGGREIVDKTLGSHIRRLHGVSGATLMGDGSVVLILNPADLISHPAKSEVPAREATREPAEVKLDEYRVMIVDDSLSVRRVVSNLIKDAGWEALTARDGLDALEIMSSLVTQPDLILVDIEMPRMDGYDLMSTLKSQEAYRHIPLVVLTSRAGSKHREKAQDVGASAYVVKPYQDEQLLDTIRQLVQESQKM